MSQFKVWVEENGLNSGFPELTNRGSDTPASNAVKQTGLQPQVNSDEIKTKEKENLDQMLAVDGAIERFDSEVPEGTADSSQINQFKELWKELKEKWEQIKSGEETQPVGDGLASDMGDANYLKAMQQNPNMAPQADKIPHGPGIFGQS